MSHRIISEINQNIKQNKLFIVATMIGTENSTPRGVGAKMIIFPDGTTSGTIGGGAIEEAVKEDAELFFKLSRSGTKEYNLSGKDSDDSLDLPMECGGNARVYFELYRPVPNIIIFGAGHIALALSRYFDILGFQYSIVDNRQEYASDERFPFAEKVYCLEYSEFFNNHKIEPGSFLVIVTHGHQFDQLCLENALSSDAGYIGMIGSKTKVKAVFDRLIKKKIDPYKDDRVFSPIGLELGDGSPEQIAVSIIAEILRVHSGGTGQSLKNKLLNNG